MNAKFLWAASTTLTVACLFAAAVTGEPLPGKPTEAALRKNYEKFMHALDFKRIVQDYPQAIDNLHSENAEQQVAGLATLSATGEPAVIPWMVPLLDSQSGRVRLYAALHIEQLVSAHCLKRRDATKPERVALKPLGANDLDLRPLAWVVRRMAQQADDGSTHAYAATMIRYLELKNFEPELRAMLQSRHPAVSNTARWALEELGFQMGQPVQADRDR